MFQRMILRVAIRAISTRTCIGSPRLLSVCSSSIANIPSVRFTNSGPVVGEQKQAANDKKESAKDKSKVRRAYALGGCLLFIWLSTHGILLYRRRSEYRKLNEKLPAIGWDEFTEKYLLSGQVKTIVFQPQFEVGNVYLFSVAEQKMKNAVVNLIHTTPDKFSRPPDVRFHFDGDYKQLEHVIKSVNEELLTSNVAKHAVELSLDQFPSTRELSFIMASTLFTLAAVLMVK